jgi:hypothetical protein
MNTALLKLRHKFELRFGLLACGLITLIASVLIGIQLESIKVEPGTFFTVTNWVSFVFSAVMAVLSLKAWITLRSAQRHIPEP